MVVEVVVVVVAVVVVVVLVVSDREVEVLDVVVLDSVVVVTVLVQSSPHMTGQLVFANWLCSPSSVQSDGGIRDPQSADSVIPWHSCGL